jgi:glutathione synthase/RimK-type ligase-like ATP-grasp enzyme
MRAHGFPIAKCWVFWEREDALKWAEDASLPVVFKLAGGAGSQNVILIRDKKSLVRIIKTMFQRGIMDSRVPDQGSLAPGPYLRLRRWAAIRKRRLLGQEVSHRHSCPNWAVHRNYVLFQEFLPGNDHDTRVTVIGDRAFAFRRMNRSDDFRSSGSGLIDYAVDQIDMDCVKQAMRISQEMGFQSMAYDFLRDRHGATKFCEISYAFVDTAIFDCPGYWDSNLSWHSGHFWPQYFQLMDALGLPDLKQPDALV